MTGARNPLDILFIGGSGTISHASVERAVRLGHRVSVLNRGRSTRHELPDEVESLVADVSDGDAVDEALAGREFDVVAQFLGFTPEHVARDVERFAGRTGQYVFISSASAYQTPPSRLPVTESTPLRNPFWQYSRDKIACEDVLVRAHRDDAFPATIVRPSHTYDETMLLTMGGWTDVARLRAGRPVVVPGDGTSLWTVTHTDDFAVGFVGLLGNPLAVGDSFQIMGEHSPTWNQIYTWLARAAGVAEPELVPVASETIARALPDLGPGLLGDKAHSMVFDCSKLRALVPEFNPTVTYDVAVHEQIAWFDAHPESQRFDEDLDAGFDRLVAHAKAL
ncbi:NAD-dependent epimerase/dehydratase family protein [Tessaracoccus rhinocerotis]|uniref:NAD-dependent epimerase/dehydratase family protein n=1 Tax=Tessaracoccus rhinocerotis TaxID=1689449 RepID=A0A553JXD4_9ACTN|nr:NAD-dependent epimerase/dehydratase family protein [Tessaracoccus rhinocerotis]TRY17093.1 NAD-dependent epimerase/dehydratase family protein [Tessaracoccus rhinocerotis]